VLRGFSRHICVACSAYTWTRIAGHQKRTASTFHQQFTEEGVEPAVYGSKRELPRFSGNLLDFHLRIMLPSDTRSDRVTEADAAWVRDHYEASNRLAANSEAFRFALESSTGWRFAKDARSAVAQLWSGIEAIFGISSELIYRVSLLSASLLTPRGDGRKLKFQEIRTLYGLRSKAVHGARLSDAKLAQAIDGSFRLLVDLLVLMIERGDVFSQDDFDSAVFE
jgi:hypothetical protein